jgi:hypothetical protein
LRQYRAADPSGDLYQNEHRRGTYINTGAGAAPQDMVGDVITETQDACCGTTAGYTPAEASVNPAPSAPEAKTATGCACDN